MFLIIGIILTLVGSNKYNAQFVFDVTNTCEIEVNSIGSRSGTLALPNKLWQIQDAETGRTIVLNLCQKIPKNYCQNSQICIYDKANPSKSINAGKHFEADPNYISDETEVLLVSKGGLSCPTGNQYYFNVTIDNAPVPLEEYELTTISECEYAIFLRPFVQPSCTKRLNGELIDLRGFRNKIFNVGTENRRFALSLCGPARSCNNAQASVCEFQQDAIIPVADKKQAIQFLNNQLVIKASWGEGSKRLQTEIHVDCNWDSVQTNGTYLIPVPQGKKYKFRLESRYGCIKPPMQCYVTDLKGYRYNLTGLNKLNNPWIAKNVSTGQIKLNMCGNLDLKTSNRCTDQHSQVCYLTGNQALNYGSILKDLTVDDDDALIANFFGGDICPKNSTLKLTSMIKFKCSGKESGPVLTTTIDCSLKLLWETPKACPQYVKTSSDCILFDAFGRRNLSSLQSNVDKIKQIDKSTYIRYNICGNLTAPCASKANVSMCLHINNQQHVLGYLSKKVQFEQTKLFMQLKGDYCSNGVDRNNVLIYFHCDLWSINNYKMNLEIKQDNCAYIMHIYTRAACANVNDKVDCVTSDANNIYNLTSLANKNHVVKSGEVDYIINLCNSVMIEDDILCPSLSGACMRNLSIPNVKKRFTSLGQFAKLKMDGSLLLEFEGGGICLRTMQHKKTTIKFLCSKVNSDLKLVSNDDCSYEFLWSTVSACPKRKVRQIEQCSYETNLNERFNLSELDQKKIILDLDADSSIILNVCSNQAIKGTANIDTNVKLVNDQNRYYLQCVLNETCGNFNELRVNIHFECKESQEKSEYKFRSSENCTYEIALHSKMVCDIFRKPTRPTTAPTSAEIVLKKQTFRRNCTLLKNGSFLNLTAFGALNVGNTSANFDEFQECPSVSYDCDTKSIKLNYFDMDLCENGFLREVWLKCNESMEKPHLVKNSSCAPIIVYPTEKVCTFLSCSTGGAVPAIVGSVFAFLLAFVFVALVIVYCYRKRQHYIPFSKRETPIYMRDTTI